MIEYGTAFAAGALIYTLLEILWRGYTHPSMTVTGGVCLVVIYMLNAFLNGKSTVIKCIAGAFCITAIELTVGIIVNIWLGLGVWDYSGVRLNFMGQICLPYSLLWLLLCYPAIKLCDLIERFVR